MKSFADISLRWQVLLAPLLLILAILVIEVVNYRQQAGADAATTRLFNETVRRLTALDEVDAFALEINGRMFRAMTLVQNGAPPKIVRTLVDTLPSDLDKLGDELSAVAKHAGENGHAVEAKSSRTFPSSTASPAISSPKYCLSIPALPSTMPLRRASSSRICTAY